MGDLWLTLGVDTGLVRESTETGNIVVEGNVDLDTFGNQIFNLLELLQVVLAEDIVPVGDNHPSHETTERGNAVALTDTNDRGVDMGGTSLQGAECVSNSASSVVVEMGLDITADNTTQGADQVVNLARASAADGIGDTNTVDTNLIDGRVDGEEIDEVAAEGILGGESDFQALGLDKLDNFNGRILDVGHILAVRMFA